MKIVKIILIAPLVLIVLGVMGTELNKAYWDREVRLLCEKDGGVTVYERVELTADARQNIRFVRVRKNSHDNDKIIAESDYFSVSLADKVIKKNHPKVVKRETLFYRTLDKKLMAVKKHYVRIGGDMPTGISHHSSYSCSQAIGFSTKDDIFLIKDK